MIEFVGRMKKQVYDFMLCDLNTSINNLPFPPASDYEIRCRPAHGFHHVLSMTGNMSEFTRVIKRQRISGNMDTPEGGLDAMLQAAVCQVCVSAIKRGKELARATCILCLLCHKQFP